LRWDWAERPGWGLLGDRNAGQEGAAFITRRYDRAEEKRGKDEAAAKSNLDQFDKNAAEQNANHERQRQSFGQQMDTVKEKRAEVEEERRYQDERRRQKKDDEDSARKSEADNNTPVGRPYKNDKGELVQKTKGGDEVPYSPKSVDEGAVLGDTRATELFKYEHRRAADEHDSDYNPKLAQLDKELHRCG
jgi:hypothetical protein